MKNIRIVVLTGEAFAPELRQTLARQFRRGLSNAVRQPKPAPSPMKTPITICGSARKMFLCKPVRPWLATPPKFFSPRSTLMPCR